MHFRIFEFWRLSAAMLVMIYHFLRFGPDDATQHHVSDMLYRLLPLMDMFFMISGFLILLRYGETLTSVRAYRSFLVRRLARFYPLYLVTFLFFVLVGMALHAGLVSSTQPGRYDPGFLWQNLALVQAWGTTDQLSFNYVAWSLSAEWFCYLLLPVFVLVIRHAGWKGLAALALAAIALLEAATEAGVIPFSSWLLADTFGAYRAFADFALGGLVMLLVRQSRWQLQSHLPAWSAFALTIAAMLLVWPAFLIVVLLAVSMFLAALAERNNPDGARHLRLLAPLGAVSFGIYLWHPVVETLVLAIGWKHGIAPLGLVNFYVFLLVPMAITVIVALASDRWFERPVSGWLNRRFGSRHASGAVAPEQAAA